MTKRYAPPAPDSRYYREGDTDYLRELLEAADISQRKAGPLLGFDERSMRNKVAGKTDFTYSEQYCLEVLADAKQQENEMSVHQTAPPRTQWFSAEKRPITANDTGKMIVGQDQFGVRIFGDIAKDGFGLVIKASEGLDVRKVPVDRVALYTLLDPPPR